jgi:hypothetical protein
MKLALIAIGLLATTSVVYAACVFSDTKKWLGPPSTNGGPRQEAPIERKTGACVSGTMLLIAKLILVIVDTTCDRR